MRSIRHFRDLDDRARSELFSRQPEAVPLDAPAEMVGESLGAVVYVPAVRTDLAGDLARLRSRGAEAVVIDLEDSVPVDERASLVSHVAAALRSLDPQRCPPAIFLRPADTEALRALHALTPPAAAHVTGVVLPKVSRANVATLFRGVRALERAWQRRLLSMPVLEAPEIAHVRSRVAELEAVRAEMVRSDVAIAAVRIGATDLGSAFGVRRDGRHTVYDIAATAAVIGDVVSTFAPRGAAAAVPIAGPVWEHFRPRGSGFARTGMDVLIDEILRDRANGLVGKTVIHPSHIGIVHALHAVEQHDYVDAVEIVAAGPGGVARARGQDRMNEYSPHRAWAQRTLRRARAFGVLAAGVDYTDVVDVIDVIGAGA